MSEKRAKCECGAVFVGINSGDTGEQVLDHSRHVHPDMRLPPIEDVIKHIGKAHIYNANACPIFLLYPRDASNAPE